MPPHAVDGGWHEHRTPAMTDHESSRATPDGMDALDLVPEGVVVLDGDHVVVGLNDRAQSLLGLTPADRGTPFFKAVRDVDVDLSSQALVAVASPLGQPDQDRPEVHVLTVQLEAPRIDPRHRQQFLQEAGHAVGIVVDRLEHRALLLVREAVPLAEHRRGEALDGRQG